MNEHGYTGNLDAYDRVIGRIKLGNLDEYVEVKDLSEINGVDARQMPTRQAIWLIQGWDRPVTPRGSKGFLINLQRFSYYVRKGVWYLVVETTMDQLLLVTHDHWVQQVAEREDDDDDEVDDYFWVDPEEGEWPTLPPEKEDMWEDPEYPPDDEY